MAVQIRLGPTFLSSSFVSEIQKQLVIVIGCEMLNE
jgi:hypothetical protein